MGQKIHPFGFRLGTTPNHDSIWFAQPKNYSENLKEDKIIRDCIKNYIQKTSGVEGIGRIKIKKRINLIQVIIYMGLPTLLMEEFIAGQLKNRISFRKAIKKAIELAEQTCTKGVQVQIAGRIDGKEIACVEWIREGRVPLDKCSKVIYFMYNFPSLCHRNNRLFFHRCIKSQLFLWIFRR
ncbi:putative ribosomal protein S3 [Medicago truncatula]|uniref:Putative ribosomal protein S3 n=1 Tax=Medicago truncatula TaxID=3880 RepID=A0A396GIS8_MEDTR|nr:putative ribosomal protein S3 [Medicago truncatula]